MGARTPWLWLAGGVPLVAYVLTSSGHSYWLDSGEFVAAAVRLDIAHPPGHPLTQLWSKAFTLLPFGSLCFRVAVGQAVATALACVVTCRTICRVLCTLPLDARLAWPLSLLGTWLAAFTYGLWFQAVRPEVYALQALCMSVVIERACKLQVEDALADVRPLLSLALALGLGLANHHFVALTLVPALLPLVVRVVRSRGMRPVLLACIFGLLGLCTYLYLPARALAHPAINLGDPSTLGRFYWVVSAQVYAKNHPMLAYQPLGERCGDVLVLIVSDFPVVCLTLVLFGLYLGLRHPALRRCTLLLLLVIVANAGARAWVGSNSGNPDVLGYLEPAFFALGALVSIALASLLWLFLQHSAGSRHALVALVTGLPLLALLQVPAAYGRSSLLHFAATDVFDDVRIRSLPPRSVVAEGVPETVFRHWESDAVEVARPDVAHIPLPFLRYPGVAEAVLRAHGELTHLVRGYLDGDVLREQDLSTLAAARPVYIDLEMRTPSRIYPMLRPQHLLHRVIDRPSRSVDAPEISRQQAHLYTTLYRRLGRDAREIETSRKLLWIHYVDAVFFAALGARDLAREEVQRGTALHPDDVRLRELSGALADRDASGPLRTEPFLSF